MQVIEGYTNGKKENKKKDSAIIILQSDIKFILNLIVQDNLSLKERAKELFKTYGRQILHAFWYGLKMYKEKLTNLFWNNQKHH